MMFKTKGACEEAKQMLKPKLDAASAEWEAAQPAYLDAVAKRKKLDALVKAMGKIEENRQMLDRVP